MQGTNKIYFNLFLPSGPTPGGGWPVAVFGGAGATRMPPATFVAASAQQDVAIAKAAVTVTLSNLTQTYTGSPLPPTATIDPPGLGLAAVWTNAPQTNVGIYTVTATVNAPNYQGSAIGTFVINPPVSAPTNLNAVAAKDKVKLSWTQSTSPGVTQNKIYRLTANGGPYALITLIGANTSYTDTQVSSGITYSYVVTAASAGRESAPSNQDSARPK